LATDKKLITGAHKKHYSSEASEVFPARPSVNGSLDLSLKVESE
jgi:hypothetical protein